MPYRFLPPLPSPGIQRTIDLFHPLILRLHEDITGIHLDQESEARLRALRGRPALLLPNHPSESEPPIMGGLARRLGEPFYYVATHELFVGGTGWLVRRLGAFSIRRGWPDRAALRMAVEVLAERGGKLVLFPEGETHMRSDIILPLNPGAAYIALRTLAQIEAQGRPTAGALPLVPIIIRYRYEEGAIPRLTHSFSRLEDALGLLPNGNRLLLEERVRRASMCVLTGIEREYSLPGEAGQSIDSRIARLYDHIESRATHIMGAPPPHEREVALRMRALFNRAFDYRDALESGVNAYERALHGRRRRAADAVLADLWRVQNFMAVGADMLVDPPTAEQIGELLYRLEKEVYGTPRTRPLRTAVVSVGAPLDLVVLLPTFKTARRTALRAATEEIERRMRELLQDSKNKEIFR